jgi:hypothetical protein
LSSVLPEMNRKCVKNLPRMKKIERGAFRPSNSLLVRHGVTCDSARVLITPESIVEGVALALSLRNVLPRALLRWMVERYVLRSVGKLRLLFIREDGEAEPFEIPAQATCEDLARHIYNEGWFMRPPQDAFWVHVKNATGCPSIQLFALGRRANDDIANKEWPYGGWRDPALTLDEVEWLNSRTLLEAGFSNRSAIDSRYWFAPYHVGRGEVIRVPELPGEEVEMNLF